MIRDKQIEEMAKAICSEYDCVIPCRRCDYYEYANCRDVKSAAKLYDAGYRKASDVAEEIFEEIERSIFRLETPYQTLHCIPDGLIAELKKKYIGKDTNVSTKESEVAKRREVSENNTVRCFHPSVTESQREAKRREDIEKSPVDCLTPSVTDSKGDTE